MSKNDEEFNDDDVQKFQNLKRDIDKMRSKGSF